MRFALIGHPVKGSLSPRLFSAAYGGRYPYDLLDGDDFEALWQNFLSDYQGINITAPYKQDAFARVDVLSATARESGAVNLAVKTPEGIAGYNTDVDGIVLSVQECGIPVQRALVVGAGGAGRAAVVAALRLGCRQVTVVNRTLEKSLALAAFAGGEGAGLEALPEAVREADLVLYTIPGPVPELALSDFSGRILLEANYRTPCLSGLPGCTYLSGKKWLLYQAVAGYGLFTGEEPDTSAMLRVL